MKYTTDRAAWLFVNLNNGQNWLNDGQPFKSNTTSGEFTIYYKDRANTQRLDVNTSYNITILCRALNATSAIDTSKNITVTTYDIAKISSAPNANIGNSHTINWSNPSGATTSLKLCKTDGTQVINYGTVTGTSKSITPTASTIYSLIPNSNKITLRYILTTTCNNTNYTNYKDCVFTVTNSDPIFSNFTYQDTNAKITALTGNNQILVKGYSNVKGTINTSNKATAKNSATMKNYKMLIGSKPPIIANYSSNADVNLTINSIDNNVIDIYAIDSRGNSTKVSKNATIKNYSNIRIVSMQAIRENNIGQAVTLKFEAQFWNASFGNVTNAITSCIYKYKNTSSSTYTDGKTTLTYTISGNKITGSTLIKGDLDADGFNISNSYNIQLVLSDKLSTSTYTIMLGSGNPAIAVYKNNVAIGQKYDTDNTAKLQINGDESVNKIISSFASNSWINGVSNAILNCRYNGYGAIINAPVKSGRISMSTYPSNDNILYFGYVPSGQTANNLSKSMNWNAENGYLSLSSGAGYIFGNNTGIRSSASYKDLFLDGAGGYVYIRPSGSSNISNQVSFRSDGSIYGFNGSTRIYGAKILYNNSSGTTGTVTLSETSANFTYLEIFFKYGSLFGSTKIYSPNGKQASMEVNFSVSQYNVARTQYKTVNISGTSITNNQYGYLSASTTNTIGVSISENKIYITTVVGYK